MTLRDFSSSNLGQLVEGLRETLEEARNSQLDLSEVRPPKDSPTYRLQEALRFSCSHVTIRYVDSFGWGNKPDPESLTEILSLVEEATEMFGKFKPARDYVEGGAAFIVQMVSKAFPDSIEPQYRHLLDYNLPDIVSRGLNSR